MFKLRLVQIYVTMQRGSNTREKALGIVLSENNIYSWSILYDRHLYDRNIVLKLDENINDA